MNFDVPDELKLQRDQANKFLSEKCPPETVRKVLEGDAPYDKDLWRQMAEMGWLGAAIPEEYGGVGLGHLAICALAEEIGYALAPVPFSSTVYMAGEAVLSLGTPAQKKRYLTGIASGQTIGTLAIAERAGALNLSNLTTHVRDGRLSGTKVSVPDGDIADFAVVAANAGDGDTRLHVVDLTGAGVSRTPIATFDPSRSHATIIFDGAPAEPIGDPQADGEFEIRRLLDRAAIMMAFEQLGGAQAALDMAVGYAKERYAFGRPIGSFQAIKHKLADVYVAVELARSNAYYGAWALHTDSGELPLAAALARISSSDAGWLANKENVQTHGGMGYTWEGNCHMGYRRAKLLGLSLGGAGEWRRRLARELKTRNQTSTAA